MTKLNEYLKIAEAARMLEVSQNTVRFWAEGGKAPVRPNSVNGCHLFRPRDLAAFLGPVKAGV